MSEIDGIGEVVTGGLLARAVEPDAGEADTGHTHEQCCLNCGIVLMGPYCAACGQKAHVHRSLRAFLADFAAGLFNFEGKFWRTLPMLAWRPGDLTRRYIAGERARFISPVALYLFSVFLMFAVLNFTGALNPSLDAMREDAVVELKKEQAKLAQLEKLRVAAAGNVEEIAQLDRKIANRKEDIQRLEGMKNGVVVSIDESDFDPDTPGWARKLATAAQNNPEQTITNIQDAASKFSWLLIPFSLPFMWLLFPFSRRFRMYDHTVFVTYSLSFMMILVIVSGVLVAANMTALAAFLFFVPPIHMYRQLRGAYQLGWLSALVRTLLLTGFCFAAAGLFAAALVAIGIF
jgi:hypothetical protein